MLLTAGESASNRLRLPGDPIFAGFKQGAFSLYFGDAPIYHFDLEGRWQRAFVDGTHYLKGLDATVHAIDRVREGPNLVLKRQNVDGCRGRRPRRRSPLDRARADRRPGRGHAGHESNPRRPRHSRSSPTTCAISSNGSARGIPRPGSLIASGISQPMARCRSCRRNARTRSFCKRPWAMPTGVAFGGAAGERGLHAFCRRVRTARQGCGRTLGPAALAEPHPVPGGKRRAASACRRRSRAYLTQIGRTFPIEPQNARTRNRSSRTMRKQPRFDGVHAFLDNFALPGPTATAGASSLHGDWCGSVSASSRATRRFEDLSQELGRRRAARDRRRLKAAGLGVSVLDAGRRRRGRTSRAAR